MFRPEIKSNGQVPRLVLKIVGYFKWLLWSWALRFPQPLTRKANRLQGIDISPNSAASPTAIPQEPLTMTPRFVAGPGTSPASEASKMPPTLISRSLPKFLLFLFFFPLTHELISTPDRLFNRVLVYF